jgi:hypothetical protein
MDRASRALARGVPPGVPASYRALADHGDVPHSTLHHRARGRRSREEKAQRQQYLYPYEEDVIVKYLLQMSDLGYPIRIKFFPSLAFRVTRHRPATDRPLKPPDRHWPKALEKRHPELIARRLKALDWNRHEKNTYRKIVHWFEVIKDILQDPAVLTENVYNMDETGVMLSMLGSVKVLVGKDDMRDYRGARVKRTTVTAIECISGDGRYLNPQYAGLAIRSFFCLRIEDVSNTVQTDRCIYITTVRVTVMPSWGRMGCPSAPVGGNRPNNQRVERPTVCGDTLYCGDQGTFYTCPSMCL